VRSGDELGQRHSRVSSEVDLIGQVTWIGPIIAVQMLDVICQCRPHTRSEKSELAAWSATMFKTRFRTRWRWDTLYPLGEQQLLTKSRATQHGRWYTAACISISQFRWYGSQIL
jgi:hypothetical protein